MAGAAGRDEAGNSAGDAEAEAGRAMEMLHRAVAEGYRNANAIAREAGLVPLRARPDFRLLILDLRFPDTPFAR
jgi:eukaryotic-like serine/threonine-protein kinase